MPVVNIYDKPDLLDEDFLEHHGIKGMHWGQRKSKSESINSGYSKAEQAKDASSHVTKRGKRKAVARVNKQLNKGKSLEKARKTVARQDLAKEVGQSAAVYYTAKLGMKTYREIQNNSELQSAILKGAKEAGDIIFGRGEHAAPTAIGGLARASFKKGAYKVTGL